MLKNYFLTALRSFWKNKTFSLINILGLSIGIGASIVIFLIAVYEYSYDRFEKDRDRVYKVVVDASFSGSVAHAGAVPGALETAIQNEVPGVELTVPVFHFQGDGTATVSVTGNNPNKPALFKKQPDVVYTNSQYFRLLPYRWIKGSPESALKDPFNVVLTESKSRLYFPRLSPDKIIGKELTYSGNRENAKEGMRVIVSGIVRDLHEHTDLGASEFISMATVEKTNLREQFMMDEWNDWMAYDNLYVKLADGNSRERMEMQLKGLYEKYGRQGNRNPANTISFHLLPLKDLHFTTDYHSFLQRVASKSTLTGLLFIAGFLLLLACINFINLSTARASVRAKEIGIRKTMGSSRSQLIRQFLGETFLIVTIATLLSMALTPLILKAFTGFTPPGLQVSQLRQPGVLVFLFVLTIAVSLLAGMYPAFVLSGFNPVRVLKNRFFITDGTRRGIPIRKVLTVSQFVIAQFFIIGTLMVSKQIHYSQNEDLGFSKEAILTFDTQFDTVASRRARLLEEIKSIPEVEMASAGFFSPAEAGGAIGDIAFKERPELHANVIISWGDNNYLPLYQVKVLAGRNVRQSDTAREVLINETYAKFLGFPHPEDILNKRLTYGGRDLPIVGVMGDFREGSTHTPIGPLAFGGMPGSRFHIRLRSMDANGDTWQRGIAKIRKAFHQVYSGTDFDYAFVDETVAKMYESEINTSRLLFWATGLTIFISCLGLLGLVIHTTNIRTKEIGIRKVLGASVTNIVSILSGGFVKLVLLAFLIAAPLAWWASHKWLEDFTYRTAISWWVFALSVALLLLFALVTLSIQTIRAAVANPVKSLKTD
jgi:hypothetical protein